MRLLRKNGVSLVVVVGIILFYFCILVPQKENYTKNHVNIKGIYLLHPLEIEAFRLADTNSRSFTKKDLMGRWTFVYFGFTSCQMACPLTLHVLDQMDKILKEKLEKNALPRILFITLDPDRDSLSRIKYFLASFSSEFRGARGSEEQLASLKKGWHISSDKVNRDPSFPKEYTLNHSLDILLVNPSAQIQAYFSYPHSPEEMAKDYLAIVDNEKQNFRPAPLRLS